MKNEKKMKNGPLAFTLTLGQKVAQIRIFVSPMRKYENTKKRKNQKTKVLTMLFFFRPKI
jgi:hypothetical protein